ncbi:MAG: radical SAM protein [bacterium]
MKKYKYLFGPVLSRRFGRSLGVDLVPQKTCTMDCVFCQLGRTRATTTVRREYVPVAGVTREIARWVRSGEQADFITLSGSGEPTLHSRFGDIIDYIHRHTSIPVLLLTNSSLFHLPEVRHAAARADIVKVSLSAWDQQSFGRVNRASDGLLFSAILKGLVAFRSGFKGILVMEVFLVPELNSSPGQAKRIAELATTVRPDRIQFNTAVRPPADRTVLPLAASRMRALSRLFHPRAELIPAGGPEKGNSIAADGESVYGLLRRHPCTIAQVAKAFDMSPGAARNLVELLVRSGRLTSTRMKNTVYYLPHEHL